MEKQNQASSSNSVGSCNSLGAIVTDGPCFSSEKQKEIRNEFRNDSYAPAGPRKKVFESPSYDKKYKPVNVKLAKSFCSSKSNIELYKNDRYPRGLALIINNINFTDGKTEFRSGADNDDVRLCSLFQQFHYEVEVHRDKTRKEMLEIVTNFTRNTKLNTADSVIVTVLSHGGEGKEEEDSVIIAADGLFVYSMEIINCFLNDSCQSLINKPKIFLIGSCRGVLMDGGVKIEAQCGRVEHDGRKVSEKVRTLSDIFIARPVPPGKRSNRDTSTGSWFIQAVVDVFAEHAHDTHLEDLMKKVDKEIIKFNESYKENFQTLTINAMGWNKHFFFNPGLARDEQTGKIIHLNSNAMTAVDKCEGIDGRRCY